MWRWLGTWLPALRICDGALVHVLPNPYCTHGIAAAEQVTVATIAVKRVSALVFGDARVPALRPTLAFFSLHARAGVDDGMEEVGVMDWRCTRAPEAGRGGVGHLP